MRDSVNSFTSVEVALADIYPYSLLSSLPPPIQLLAVVLLLKQHHVSQQPYIHSQKEQHLEK